MKLVIGGYAQGKLDYVLRIYQPDETMVFDGSLPEESVPREKTVIINHFHNWVKKRMSERECPEEEVRTFLEHRGDCVIICDEVGNGIVPVDAFEREYRERLGRILIELADKAESVERVICRIGQRIK